MNEAPLYIIIFISSNYLFVSGEHRVHCNTNVCSRLCCTTHSFQAFRYSSLLPYMGGSVFILVFRRGVCANAAVYFKAISPMTQPHRFIVCLHIHNITYSFRISPCPLCSLLWISGLWHSTEIDSLSVVGFFRCLLRLLIIIRPDTPIFLTGEQLVCFSGPFVPCFFLGISWQLDSTPSTLLSGAAASAMIPTGQAEKTLHRRESPISYD